MNRSGVPVAENQQPAMLHDLDGSIPEEKTMKKAIVVVYAILIILGGMTGYVLASPTSTEVSTGADSGKTAGVEDTSTFKDTAVGIVEKGGMEGEGTHKLLREGGPSQTAYLVSSLVDMDEFVGKKVKIWGETMAAKNVAWLMDVGRVEVQE